MSIMTEKLLLIGVLILIVPLVFSFDPIIITTQGSSSITTTTADLSGSLANLLAPEAEVWFNYGLSPVGPWTNSTVQNVSADGLFSATITDLESETTYYFRARGNDGAADDTGSVLSFTTLSNIIH